MIKAKVDSKRMICDVNDALRRTFVGGLVTVTAGIANLPAERRRSVLAAVQAFDAFTEDNDVHGEHDFGVVEVDKVRSFWKIDYYDGEMEMMSPDPADPTVTRRVLTIMLADEY